MTCTQKRRPISLQRRRWDKTGYHCWKINPDRLPAIRMWQTYGEENLPYTSGWCNAQVRQPLLHRSQHQSLFWTCKRRDSKIDTPKKRCVKQWLLWLPHTYLFILFPSICNEYFSFYFLILTEGNSVKLTLKADLQNNTLLEGIAITFLIQKLVTVEIALSKKRPTQCVSWTPEEKGWKDRASC